MVRFALENNGWDHSVEVGLEVVRPDTGSLLWNYRCAMMRMVALGRYVWETSEKKETLLI